MRNRKASIITLTAVALLAAAVVVPAAPLRADVKNAWVGVNGAT